MIPLNFSIVVPSRNLSNFIPCIEAVHKYEPDAQIILVNDGIPPEEVPPWMIQAQGEKPFIFARNCNIGIKAALDECGLIDVTDHSGSNECAGIVLLNDDALLETPGGFSLLAKTAKENPGIGIIAPACNNIGNPNQFSKGIGLRGENRTVCFVCVYIPRRTIQSVGLLDERFIHYGMDDDDYSLRVRKAGLQLAIHDGCFVDHLKLPSSYRGSGGGDFRKNMKLFIDKWGMDNWGIPASPAYRKWGVA